MPSRFPAVLAVLAFAGTCSAEAPKETQIVCQVRVLTVRDDLFARLGLDFKPGTLSDVQLHAVLEAAQGDKSTNVTQCPKVTTLDGVEAVVKATQQQLFATGLEATRVKGAVAMIPRQTAVETGTTLTLCGKASADRKTVTVRVNYKDARIETVEMIPVTSQITPVFEGGSQGQPIPFTQFLQSPKVETLTVDKKDLAIPSGGHLVIAGPTRTQEERTEFGPPVLSKIPYLNRMYKNVGVTQVTVRTYLIVSPVVLDVPEEPARRR